MHNAYEILFFIFLMFDLNHQNLHTLKKILNVNLVTFNKIQNKLFFQNYKFLPAGQKTMYTVCLIFKQLTFQGHIKFNLVGCHAMSYQQPLSNW